MSERKRVLGIYGAASSHWVGDGFPVRTVFPSQGVPELSPFLMLDYAGPAHFKPATRPRGVEEHPHRGFETVTISYQGSLKTAVRMLFNTAWTGCWFKVRRTGIVQHQERAQFRHSLRRKDCSHREAIPYPMR